jgi:hypothetical protein
MGVSHLRNILDCLKPFYIPFSVIPELVPLGKGQYPMNNTSLTKVTVILILIPLYKTVVYLLLSLFNNGLSPILFKHT